MNRWARNAALAATGVLGLCVALLAARTWRWLQISDAVLMHYVVFLLRHGMAPYRQITDVNLPGSYAVDWLAGSLFGGSASGWRAFDWSLTALVGVVLTAVGRRAGSTVAGLFAAGLFAVWHVRDGVAQAGQRDLVVTVLVLLGYAALFRARRTGSLSMAVAFGLYCGAATTIKPQAALFMAAVLPLVSQGPAGQPTRIDRGRAILASAAGFLMPVGAMGAWLLTYHALGTFLDTARGLMVYHAGMARHSVAFLLAHALPWQFWPVLLAALAMMAAKRSWCGFGQQAALLGVAGGMLSFVLQGKAYPYHRYPLLAFVLLLFAIELGRWLSRPPARGFAAAAAQACVLAALAFTALWLAPEATARALRQDWRTTPSLDSLQADLGQLGGTSLASQVQCMDTMAGCVTVLDRMQLQQATGFLYDCYFFAPGRSAFGDRVRDRLRARFLAELASRPPRVFVVTDQWCFKADPEYAKLAQWPAFAALLGTDYRLAQERRFDRADKRLATWPFDYRLYVRRQQATSTPAGPP